MFGHLVKNERLVSFIFNPLVGTTFLPMEKSEMKNNSITDIKIKIWQLQTTA